MLQPTEHSKNAVAVREEPDGKVAAAPLFGNQLREIATGQREVVPRAVGLLFVGGQRHGRNLFGLDTEVLKQLPDSALFQIVRSARNIGHIPFTHVGHLDERHANGSSIAISALPERGRQQWHKTHKQQGHPTFLHCLLCDLRAVELCALCAKPFCAITAPAPSPTLAPTPTTFAAPRSLPP